MTTLSYRLKPFPDGQAPGIAVAGRIVRDRSTLLLESRITGDVDGIFLESPADAPVRRHGLWEGTCLELFLAPAAAESYWELNMSPAGHWNVYRFSAYRRGMAEEESFKTLPFDFQRKPGSLELAMEIDLSGILPDPVPLHAAVCAVVRHRSGAATYWAVTHCAGCPDFHRRESFVLVV